MDPSPFHERDLDDDAEEFIVGWAREFPRCDPVSLVVHVDQLPPHGDAQRLLETAVHHSSARFPSRHNFEAFGICAQTAIKIRPQEMRGNSQLLQSVNLHAAQNFEHEDNSYGSADGRQ
jgi:hypothetical protein